MTGSLTSPLHALHITLAVLPTTQAPSGPLYKPPNRHLSAMLRVHYGLLKATQTGKVSLLINGLSIFSSLTQHFHLRNNSTSAY